LTLTNKLDPERVKMNHSTMWDHSVQKLLCGRTHTHTHTNTQPTNCSTRPQNGRQLNNNASTRKSETETRHFNRAEEQTARSDARQLTPFRHYDTPTALVITTAYKLNSVNSQRI